MAMLPSKWIPFVVPALAVMMVFLTYVIMVNI